MRPPTSNLAQMALRLEQAAEEALELQRPMGWAGCIVGNVIRKASLHPVTGKHLPQGLDELLQTLAIPVLQRLEQSPSPSWPACWAALEQPEVRQAIPLAQFCLAWNCLVNYDLPIALATWLRQTKVEDPIREAAPEQLAWLLCSTYQEHLQLEFHRRPALLLLRTLGQVTPWRFFRFKLVRACQHFSGATNHLRLANEAQLPTLLGDLDHLACVLGKRIISPGLPAGLALKVVAPFLK